MTPSAWSFGNRAGKLFYTEGGRRCKKRGGSIWR